MIELSREELSGGYRRLCATLLAQAAFATAGRPVLPPARSAGAIAYRQEMALQRKVALGWLDGGDAVIPFTEACEQLDTDPDRTRDGLIRFARQPDALVVRRYRLAAS